MSKVLRPRRGRQALMNSYKAGSLILEKGEVFFEYPDTGIGTNTEGTGVGIKIGDGVSRYMDLPYYLSDHDVDNKIQELKDTIATLEARIRTLENRQSGD